MFSRRRRLMKELRELDRELEALEAQKDNLDENTFLGRSTNLFLRRGVVRREMQSMDAHAKARRRGDDLGPE